ncbi:hypothetical protein TsFJ059_009304 [Trichoderma semiorbis]|uniref:NB-ARC domain-containing protein n=1 Tax=Trichoderma semiorbis TaxID=1491008 RepID=A0A9P8HJA3_9HYPO|nr:hypothetical protein TsFJ059_009304 [Trichoderma semiorbis]
MLETHGQNWHREVHLPAWWSCPLCNNQETTYPKSQDLSDHISKLHSDVFTEQQIQIIVHQSQLRAPRPQDTCPLCCLSMNDEQNTNRDIQPSKETPLKVPNKGEQLTESSKRIKIETGSVQLDQHSDTDTGSSEQETPNPQIPVSQSQGQLNIETIARHVAAHLQGMMLFSFRMISLDAAVDKSTDDKVLSGNTDNDLSRLGSNQQLSVPETQEIVDSINDLLVQDESMDVDYPLVEDAIPDCEQDLNWQDFIPYSEPLPEADTFLQQVIDSGAFQAKNQSLALETTANNASDKQPIIARPRTPPATIIIFPFRHDPDFTGHDILLHDLVYVCSSPPARLALVGIGGIGKSQLAIELAYRLVTSAKMSVFWVNAESQLSINESFRTISSNLSSWRWDISEASSQVSHRWLSEERNGRWILFLDGANDHSIFQDELYLPKSRNGTIVITTRRRDVAYRLTGNQQNVVEIGSMSVHNAVSLLERKLGRTAKEQFPKDGAASGLVKSLGLIPLAICRAAAYIQSTSTKPPIKDDDGRSYRLDNSDSLLRRHHLDRDQKMLEALFTKPPESSNRGDSPPPIVYSDEDDALGDTFMYEGDEDEHIINQEDFLMVKSAKKGAKVGYRSHGIPFDHDMVVLSEEDEPSAETERDMAHQHTGSKAAFTRPKLYKKKHWRCEGIYWDQTILKRSPA